MTTDQIMCYTEHGCSIEHPVGDSSYGGGCFLECKEEVSMFFAFLERGRWCQMYMTWEAFFPFCMVIVSVISLVVSIYTNKKR